MEKTKNINRPRIRTSLVVLAMACAVVLLSLGQKTGGSVTHARPNSDLGGPGACPIPPCTRYIGPEGEEFCECPTPTPPLPTPTPFLYGPKGIGDAWQNWATPIPSGPVPGTNLDVLDFDWYYDWRVDYVPGRGNDPRYVRMVWCDDTSGIVAAAQQDFNHNRRGRVWLVYNEPDHGVENTCGVKFVGDPPKRMNNNPEWAARHFSDVYDLIKGADPHARVFAGGLVFLNTQETRNWWQDFTSTLQADGDLYKLEGVHVHVYPIVSTSTNWPYGSLSCNNASDDYCVPDLAQVANDWYDQMHVGLGLGDRPIWITEMGWLYCVGQQNDWSWVRNNFMEPISQWFAGDSAWPYDPQVPLNPGYETVAWYVTRDDNVYPCTYLLDSRGSGGAPTELGQFWNGYQP